MRIDLAEVRPIDGDIGLLLEGNGRRLSDLATAEVAALFERHGVLLLRGFTSKGREESKQDFVSFSDRLTAEFSNYRGGGLRFAALDRQSVDGMPTLMTTTGHTQKFGIPLHGEMYYLRQPPGLIWFYADLPPARDGETTLADGAEVFAQLKPASQDFFRHNRIKYVRALVDGDWQATFMTDDLAEAERFCAEADLVMRFDAEAKVLRTEFTCSALREVGGRTVFINNLLFIHIAELVFKNGWAKQNLPGLRSPDCPIVVRAEDGSPLPPEVLSDVQAVSERLTRRIAWQQGDIAMIDNRRILHGRRDTDGGPRSILVRIGEPSFALKEAA